MQDPTNISSRLTAFSLKRRITVLVTFLSILVVGAIATLTIPLELFPRGFQAESLNVFVPWPNAPVQEVLDEITIPLEEELSTVRHLDGINSWSFRDGCNVFLRFKPGTDMAVAYRETRDRVQRARLRFPEDVDRVFIRKEDISGIPVAVIGLAIDPSLTDYYNLVDKAVVQNLARIDGVASVDTNGLEEKEVLIEVDKQKVEGHRLNIYELTQSLHGDNFTMASGHTMQGNRKLLLRSVATYATLDELENRPITDRVRLKDIASIKYEEPEKRYSVRVNSRPAVAVVIFKEGQANTVELSRKIRAAFDQMKESPRLQGMQMEMIFNQGEVVEASIHTLVASGRLGGIFAALILFLFLRRFRLTGIITLSIPLSLVIAIIVMFFLGETLNILTLLGLMICVGLLVDNSVVVAENIHRHHQAGLDRKTACLQGAGEIALAITMATLTTVIVFLPAGLVEGQGQFFLLRLALPVSVSLLASLMVALAFIPLSVYLTLPARRQKEAPLSLFQKWHLRLNGVLRRFYNATFERLNHQYSRLLEFFLTRRLDLVLGLAGLFALTQWIAFREISFVESQEEDQTSFRIQVEVSPEYGFEDLKAYFADVERILADRKDHYGLKGYFVMHDTNGGRITGWLDENRESDMSAQQMAEELSEIIPERAGIKLRYGDQNRAEDADDQDTYVVRLEGHDALRLEQIASQIEPLFLRVQGVLGSRQVNEPAPNELGLVVDREIARQTQVNPQLIAGVVGYALRGQTLPKFSYDGRQIPVRIRFEEADRKSLEDLHNFLVPTPSGQVLPLRTFTTPDYLQSPDGIFRRDKKVTRPIALELKKDQTKETRERLHGLQRQIDLPEGVHFGEQNFRSVNEELENLKFAALLSIVFIYLLMGFLFESFILPLSILCTIPLASLGVAWIHYFTGKDIDFLGVVGAILLIGVVVNNGIVLIDTVNRFRTNGMNRQKALLTAAHLRYRPILMTALTTIIGMIPLAVTKPGDMGLSYKSFGLTLIGGMTSATLLTLLVIPIFYTFFDDARSWWSKIWRTGRQNIGTTDESQRSDFLARR